MKKICVLVLTLITIGMAASVRVTAGENVYVEAKEQREYPTEAVFGTSPTGETDRIIVTNEDVKYKGRGVEDDPYADTHDFYVESYYSQVTVAVEGRKGIGALYWVKVEPIGEGPGEDGPPPDYLWAEARDLKSGTLVLRDAKTGVSVFDAGDGASAVLFCTPGADDKGHVTFRLHDVGGTSYNWSVPGVQNGSGTLTGPNYQGSLSGIDLGEYTLTVDDGQGFSREIEFAVFLVSMDEGGLLKDEQGKIVRIATRFEEPWSGIDIEDSAAIINFNVTPDEENEGDFGYVIDVVDDPNHTDVGFVDPSTWGNQDHAVTYYAPEEKKNDLRPFTGHVGVANASFFIGAFHGEERNEFDLISREHQRTGVWVDSNFVFIADVQEDKETAIDFILQKYDWVDLTPIDGRDNISYEPDGSGYGMAFYYTKRIELYDAAFNAENYCASTIIHELNHIEEGTWYSGGGPEEKAYATEYENAYRTGVTKDWIDINWEEQMGNTNYPDEGYQGYEDDD